MAIIDGLALVARTRAFVGRSIIPQGMCLNFVWQRAGALSSIGSSVGRMSTAWESWLGTPEGHKRRGDWNAPIGSVVYYGPSPTRTDKNKNAGDIGVSIGGGYGIFTDAAGQGSRVGIMTLRARAAQIGRPYEGWADSLGGHSIRLATNVTAGELATAISNAPTPEQQEAELMSQVTILTTTDSGADNGQTIIIGGIPVNLGPGNTGSIKSVSGAPVQIVACSKAVRDSVVAAFSKDHEDRIIYKEITGGYALLERGLFRILHSMDAVNALARAGVNVVEINSNEFKGLAETFTG